MELRHLRYFIAVAEERHYGRAAQRLGRAQPPVSRQIQALEKELGYPLFDRSKRQVELTPAGAVFLEHTRRVFRELEVGVHQGRRASQGESGRLRVGYLSSLAYTGLTELLRAYRASFPTVEVALRELSPAEQVEALKAGTIDVGFVRAPLEDGALAFECIRREPLLVVLPVEHRLAARARLKLEWLAEEGFVLFPRSRGPAYFDFLMSLCRAAGFTPRIVQEAPQLDVMNLVAAGFGVSLVPASLRDVLREGIVLRPIVGAPSVNLLLAWRREEQSPTALRFVQMVRRIGVKKPDLRDLEE